MALVDMKRSKADKKAEQKSYNTIGGIGGDDYHHGLTVHLDHDSLQKLGIDTMPKSGDVFHVQAHGHVKSSEEESRDGGQTRRRITLELRKMALDAQQKQTDQVGEVPDKKLKGAKDALDAALAQNAKPKK